MSVCESCGHPTDHFAGCSIHHRMVFVPLVASHSGQIMDFKDPEREVLKAAILKVLEGFEKGFFIRDATKDSEPQWILRLMPYIAALAVLAKEAEK